MHYIILYLLKIILLCICIICMASVYTHGCFEYLISNATHTRTRSLARSLSLPLPLPLSLSLSLSIEPINESSYVYFECILPGAITVYYGLYMYYNMGGTLNGGRG